MNIQLQPIIVIIFHQNKPLTVLITSYYQAVYTIKYRSLIQIASLRN